MTELNAAVARFAAATAAWTPAAWAAAAPGVPGESRADVVHGLVQRLADLAATAESQTHRPVPRLDNDLALPDQLRVIAADLLAATPAPAHLADAETALHAARRALWS
jgi:hypothetical protein